MNGMIHLAYHPKYLATFIDDITWMTNVYFICQNSDLFEAFKDYKTNAENQMGYKNKALGSNNGSEYCSKYFL